jgi:ankyrin repeat protein
MHAQNGRTALFYAAIKGHAECVRLLLDAGADTEAKNNVRGRSIASAVGRARVVCCACTGVFMC